MKASCVSAGKAFSAALLLAIAGCAPSAPAPDVPSPHAADPAAVARLSDTSISGPERIERILAEARPGNVAAIPALRAVLSDKSRTAFVLVPSKEAPYGLVVAENPSALPTDRGPERAAAVIALEAIGSWRALADVLHALDDRDGLVAVHAARAALKFGSRAGIPRAF
jgi:HEAT repeat protein